MEGSSESFPTLSKRQGITITWKYIMAIALSPYDVKVYNSTPDLDVALQKHNANALGLVLLHHHFPLGGDEYPTEVHGISTAWKSQTGSKPR